MGAGPESINGGGQEYGGVQGPSGTPTVDLTQLEHSAGGGGFSAAAALQHHLPHHLAHQHPMSHQHPHQLTHQHPHPHPHQHPYERMNLLDQ